MYPDKPNSKSEAVLYVVRGLSVTAGRLVVVGMFATLILVQMASLSQTAPEQMKHELATAFQLFGNNIGVWGPFWFGVVGWAIAPILINFAFVSKWWWGEQQ